MEFPNLGKYCTADNCNKLDFLPIKCDACLQIFCEEHYNYTTHNCPNAYKKNNQVPVCPLCNNPVPIGRNQQPDIAVGAHIDNDCKAKGSKKVYTNRCNKKGCKIKEVIPVLCPECSLNFCLKHRHPTDHSCEGKAAARQRRFLEAAVSRQQQRNTTIQNTRNTRPSDIQGNMSEDEALARAIQLSMQENSAQNAMTQEEMDMALARQLQAMESAQPPEVGGARNSRDRCIVS